MILVYQKFAFYEHNYAAKTRWIVSKCSTDIQSNPPIIRVVSLSLAAALNTGTRILNDLKIMTLKYIKNKKKWNMQRPVAASSRWMNNRVPILQANNKRCAWFSKVGGLTDSAWRPSKKRRATVQKSPNLRLSRSIKKKKMMLLWFSMVRKPAVNIRLYPIRPSFNLLLWGIYSLCFVSTQTFRF